MRENRPSGSEGGEAEPNRPFLPLSALSVALTGIQRNIKTGASGLSGTLCQPGQARE